MAEKARENALRALGLTVVRWDWSDMMNPRAFTRILNDGGLRSCVGGPDGLGQVRPRRLGGPEGNPWAGQCSSDAAPGPRTVWPAVPGESRLLGSGGRTPLSAAIRVERIQDVYPPGDLKLRELRGITYRLKTTHDPGMTTTPHDQPPHWSASLSDGAGRRLQRVLIGGDADHGIWPPHSNFGQHLRPTPPRVGTVEGVG